MQMKKPTEAEIKRQLSNAVGIGHIEDMGNGRYRITDDGESHVKHQLKTDREARAFFRSMNELHGQDIEQGIPEWEGDGDEFPPGVIRKLPQGFCPECAEHTYVAVVMEDKSQVHLCTNCDLHREIPPCSQCGEPVFAKVMDDGKQPEPYLVCNSCGCYLAEALETKD